MNLGLQGLFYSSFLVINVIFKFGFGGLVLYFYVIKKKKCGLSVNLIWVLMTEWNVVG